ncbi:hypothetical protein F5Y01DRAFT_316018 [Xylaria sp. FL0043]|nr:hypothetical protein F5Y01DRAFT_316018 [Xylaria sp. FL0043]
MSFMNQNSTVLDGKGKLSGYSGAAGKSSDSPSQPKPKQENQPVVTKDLYDYWRAVWGEEEDEMSYENSVCLQRVYSHGPLFKLLNIPLDEDREAAKRQWHCLCVEFEQKKKIAMTLLEENQQLKKENKWAGEICKTLRESLDWAHQDLRELGDENKKLREKIRRITQEKMSPATQYGDDLDI